MGLPVDLIARSRIPAGLANQPAVAVNEPPAQPVQLTLDQLQRLLTRMDRRANFIEVDWVVNQNQPQLVLPQANRTYFLIQNLSPAANIFMGFGKPSTLINGIKLVPLGDYEPLWVPQNDIWINSDTNGAFGTIIYASTAGR